MHTSKSLVLLFAAIALSLGSCGAPNNVSSSNSITPLPNREAPAPAASTPEAPATGQPFSTLESATTAAAPAAEMVSVTIYTADSDCAQLVPEQVEVPENEAMQAAVGKVLTDESSSSDLKLSGYRVSVADNGVATVDFRLAADSQRQFTSLSTCENLALMGGVRETLTQNPEWQIESVRFTERGEEILM